MKNNDTIIKFKVKEHTGISPEEYSPKFFYKHLSAYVFTLPYITEKTILEVGFGDGYGSDLLADHAKNVTAIDLFDNNIALARKKYSKPNLNFAQMDAVDLKFKDREFDTVVSFQVIEHIPRQQLISYLSEIKRVLKPGGSAFISTLNLEKNMKCGRQYEKNMHHDREFGHKDFNQLLSKVFNNVTVYGLFLAPKHKFFEKLKKSGIFRYVHPKINIVDRFYKNITADDFVWDTRRLSESIDLMGVFRLRCASNDNGKIYE